MYPRLCEKGTKVRWFPQKVYPREHIYEIVVVSTDEKENDSRIVQEAGACDTKEVPHHRPGLSSGYFCLRVGSRLNNHHQHLWLKVEQKVMRLGTKPRNTASSPTASCAYS